MAELLIGTDLGSAHVNVLNNLREEDESFSEDSISEDVERLQAQAVEVAATILNDNTVEGIEKEFYYRVGTNKFMIHGFIDAILRNRNGELWIVDFKTAGRRWSESQFLLSTQDVLYAAAVEGCVGEEVAGSTYAIFAPAGLDYKTRRLTPESKHNVLWDLIRTEAARHQSRTETDLPMSPLWGVWRVPLPTDLQDLCSRWRLSTHSRHLLRGRRGEGRKDTDKPWS